MYFTNTTNPLTDSCPTNFHNNKYVTNLINKYVMYNTVDNYHILSILRQFTPQKKKKIRKAICRV